MEEIRTPFDIELHKKHLDEGTIKVNMLGHFNDKTESWMTPDELMVDTLSLNYDLKISMVRFIIEQSPEKADEFMTFEFINLSTERVTCPCCGKTLNLHFESESEVSLVHITYKDETGRRRVVHKDECEFRGGLLPKKTTINFKTPLLIFADYFRNRDNADFLKVVDEYTTNDLQHNIGRQNLMNYYADTYNVGFGQMSNMSLQILVNAEKTHIIITESNSFGYDEGEEKKEEDYNKLIESGYTDLGELCLDMWRWMCIEKQTLIDLDFYKGGRPDDHTDYIETEIQTGDWEITHSFDNQPAPSDGSLFIYSELKLK